MERDQDVYVRGLHLLNGFRAFNRFQTGRIGRRQFAASVARLPWDPGDFEPRNPFQHPRDVLAEVGHALMGVPQNTERYWPREQLIEFAFPLDQKFRHVIEIKRGIR